jgi:hypothetical protein
MSKIDFKQNSFDGIVFLYSLFHASKQDVPKILAKTNLMLNDDGVVYLVMQEGEGEVVLDEPFLPSEKIYFNLYTEEEIVSILGAAGFEVVSKERIAPGKEEIPYSKLVLIAKKMGRENEEAKT